jgi:hypothetical protein
MRKGYPSLARMARTPSSLTPGTVIYRWAYAAGRGRGLMAGVAVCGGRLRAAGRGRGEFFANPRGVAGD